MVTGGWGESPGNSDRWAHGRGKDGAHGGGRLPDELAKVEGQQPFVAAAGESMLMDLRCWHTALPNKTDRNREGFIIQFSPFRKKQVSSSPHRLLIILTSSSPHPHLILPQEGLTRAGGQRLFEAGKLPTPLMRQVRWSHSGSCMLDMSGLFLIPAVRLSYDSSSASSCSRRSSRRWQRCRQAIVT